MPSSVFIGQENLTHRSDVVGDYPRLSDRRMGPGGERIAQGQKKFKVDQVAYGQVTFPQVVTSEENSEATGRIRNSEDQFLSYQIGRAAAEDPVGGDPAALPGDRAGGYAVNC